MNNYPSLDNKTNITLDKIVKIERNWHLFKAGLYILIAIATFSFIAYETNRSVMLINQKNIRVENLLRCSLPAFTPQNYPQADKIIKQCLEVK